MKLMIVIRDLRFGGAQRQVLALTKGLRERGHAVTVVVFYPDLHLAHDLRDSGIELLKSEQTRSMGRARKSFSARPPDPQTASRYHPWLSRSSELALFIRQTVLSRKTCLGDAHFRNAAYSI